MATAAHSFEKPVMDWTDDSLIYNRLQKFKRDCNEIFGGPLHMDGDKVRVNWLLRWLPEDVKDSLYSSRDNFSNPKQVWELLEEKYKMKVNEISAFNRLRNLTQGSKTLSEFIVAARKLVKECNYPTDGDRLLRDTIVSGINSKTAYTKCIDKGSDLTLEEALKIVQNEEDVKRQVELTRPEFRATGAAQSSVHAVESENPEQSVHKMHGAPQRFQNKPQ